VEREEIDRRLREARRAVLGTAGRDGRPHLVPIVFAYWEGRLYSAVDRKPKTTLRLRRLENIRANPAVSALVDCYRDDWTRLWWIRVDGRARILEWTETPAGARRALLEKYPAYAAAPPPGPVLEITAERVASWSAAAGAGSELHR